MKTKILWDKMMEYYKCEKFEFGYFSYIEECNKNNIFPEKKDAFKRKINGIQFIFGGKSPIFLKCDICGNIFTLYEKKFNKRNQAKHKDIIVCSQACLGKKKEIYLKQSVKDGTFWNFGKIVTAEEIEKRLNTIEKKYAEGKPWVIERTGKSLIEYYGEEGANRTVSARKKGLDAYIENNGFPHSNCPHSEESKQQMSESHINFLKSERALEKKYPHPVTGELLDWHENNSITTSLYFENMSEDERLSWSQKTVSRLFLSDGNWGANTKKGYIIHWLLKDNQKYDSSLEEAYFKKLNNDKIFWKKNKSIYIPYIHPITEKKHYYIPDVLIYANNDFENLIEIIEVKPSEFVFSNKDKPYYKITKSKLEALSFFCKSNNLKCTIITELDVKEFLNESKKFKSKQISKS